MNNLATNPLGRAKQVLQKKRKLENGGLSEVFNVKTWPKRIAYNFFCPGFKTSKYGR